MKLLLATDGSEFSTAAALSVGSRPWPEGTEVKVISAPGLVLLQRECPYFEHHQVEELNAASMKESHQAVASPVEMLSRSGLKVHTRVPLLHVYGDADTGVPWDENTGVIAERYQKLGGPITLIPKPGVGHHPHGLSEPAPIVEFIVKHASSPPTE